MRSLYVLVALACLACMVSGCGGGGGGVITVPGTDLVIGGDTYAGPVITSMSRVPLINAPLDEGAQVTVYNFENGSVLATGNLDAAGLCELKITPGLTVAVVIVGERDGKPYRLSTIISDVPVGGGTFIANPTTSIAAETLAQTYYKKNMVLDEDTWQAVLAEASDFVADDTEADFSLEGEILTGQTTDFGTPSGLGSSAQPVLDSVPEVDGKIALAKNAVRQIKTAGVPLAEMLGQEYPDLMQVGSEIEDAYSYTAWALGLLVMPAIFGDLMLDDESTSIFDLDLGTKYIVTRDDMTDELVLEVSTGGVQGKIILEAGEGAPIAIKLEAVPTTSGWTLTQTATDDPDMLYTVSIPNVDPDNLGTNPSYTLALSLQDKETEIPITFSGTLSGTGSAGFYNKIVFNGALNSANLKTTGKLEATFRSTVPAGAPSGDTIYDYPTGLKMQNASIQLIGEDATIALTGAITVVAALMTIDDDVVTEPTSVQLTGGYSNSNSGLSFDGNITANWTNPPNNEPNTMNGRITMDGELAREGFPTYQAELTINKSGGTISSNVDLRVGANSLIGSGTATINAAGDITAANMNLTNQAGVRFELELDGEEVVGAVRVSGSQVATIGDSPISGMRITYDTDPVTYDDI